MVLKGNRIDGVIKTSSGDVVVLETPLGLHAASQQEDRGVVCVTLEDSESSKDSNLKHGKGQCDHVEPIAPEHAVEDGTGERTRSRQGPRFGNGYQGLRIGAREKQNGR